jgi:hypothetical protein
MGDMTVMDVDGVGVPILLPLLQLAALADLVGPGPRDWPGRRGRRPTGCPRSVAAARPRRRRTPWRPACPSRPAGPRPMPSPADGTRGAGATAWPRRRGPSRRTEPWKRQGRRAWIDESGSYGSRSVVGESVGRPTRSHRQRRPSESITPTS